MSSAPTRNVLYEQLFSQRRSFVRRQLSVLDAVDSDDVLSLFGYFERKPEKFYSQDVLELASVRLAQIDAYSHAALDSYLARNQEPLDRALRFLAEINRQSWHDDLEGEHDYHTALLIDRDLHPAYLRLTEGVLVPFARLFAYFSRQDRGAGTDGLDPYAIEQELARSELCLFVRSFNRTVRNALAHGAVDFTNGDFHFCHRGGAEALSTDQMIHLVDDLVDDCNALALAYRLLFLSTDRPSPRQHVVEEAQAETTTPWWRVEGCLASKTVSRESQLNIYVRVDTDDQDKLHWSALQTAEVFERLLPGKDRYFISCRGKGTLPGFAAFHGAGLREHRIGGDVDYDGVFETLAFMSANRLPNLARKGESLLLAIRAQIHAGRERARFSKESKHVSVRHVKAHRNGWGIVVNGSVVIGGGYSCITRSLIQDNPHAVVRAAVGEARREGVGNSWANRLPVAFAQIAVLQRDYRRRRLRSFGLADDLVCTVRLHRTPRIRSPDIYGSEIEIVRGHRIAWNRSWLAAQG